MQIKVIMIVRPFNEQPVVIEGTLEVKVGSSDILKSTLQGAILQELLPHDETRCVGEILDVQYV